MKADSSAMPFVAVLKPRELYNAFESSLPSNSAVRVVCELSFSNLLLITEPLAPSFIASTKLNRSMNNTANMVTREAPKIRPPPTFLRTFGCSVDCCGIGAVSEFVCTFCCGGIKGALCDELYCGLL